MRFEVKYVKNYRKNILHKELVYVNNNLFFFLKELNLDTKYDLIQRTTRMGPEFPLKQSPNPRYPQVGWQAPFTYVVYTSR